MNEKIKELREQAWALVSNEQRERGELYESPERWNRCDEKFAELVAEHEREECAKVCEAGIIETTKWDSSYWNRACEDAAFRIRARGESLAQPEQDFDAIAERQLASLKRATKQTTEDATVRAVHKMADEPQPEQEPVAWANREELGNIKNFDANIYGNGGFDDAVPLYTTPPLRKPLTDEEIEELDDKTRKVTIDKGTPIGYFAVALARAVEAAHGIKP